MKNKWFLLVIFVFLISNIYAYNTDYNTEFYYGEIIDIGISSIDNPNIEYVNVLLYTDFETYLDNYYELDEISEIPLYLDDQTSPNLKIKYKFLDTEDNLIEEKEFLINIVENTDIGNFYLCYTGDCKDSVPNNYDFWYDEDVFVFSDKIDYEKYTYNMIIETDKVNDNVMLLTDNNINIPYTIPNTTIAGHERYRLTIEIIDKIREKTYTQNINFALSEITEADNRLIMDRIIEINEQNEATNANINDEDFDDIEDKQTEISEDKEEPIHDDNIQDTENKPKNNVYLIILIVIFVLIIFIMIFSKPNKEKNRRTSRKKK